MSKMANATEQKKKPSEWTIRDCQEHKLWSQFEEWVRKSKAVFRTSGHRIICFRAFVYAYKAGQQT